jgi:hypothetical protein
VVSQLQPKYTSRQTDPILPRTQPRHNICTYSLPRVFHLPPSEPLSLNTQGQFLPPTNLSRLPSQSRYLPNPEDLPPTSSSTHPHLPCHHDPSAPCPVPTFLTLEPEKLHPTWKTSPRFPLPGNPPPTAVHGLRTRAADLCPWDEGEARGWGVQ